MLTTQVDRKNRTIHSASYLSKKQKVRVTVVSLGRQLNNGENECHCLSQKELRNGHERRTEDELSKQREFINLHSPSFLFILINSSIFSVFFLFQSVTFLVKCALALSSLFACMLSHLLPLDLFISLSGFLALVP